MSLIVGPALDGEYFYVPQASARRKYVLNIIHSVQFTYYLVYLLFTGDIMCTLVVRNSFLKGKM